MKKSLIFKNLIAVLLVSGSVFFASCVKDRNTGAVDFSQLTPIMQIPEGGLSRFQSQALLFDGADVSDTAYFRVNYAATAVAPNDIVVTLGYDAAALAAYNAANPTATYQKFPDSIYRFTQTSVTVKAGQSYTDVIKLTVFPNKIDPSKNYMLPISITAASGVKISANFGTIYYHFIGNCLAGAYNNVGTRYNYTGFVLGGWGGTLPFPGGYSTAACPAVKVLAPLSSTVTVTDYANLGPGTNRDYYFTYDCAAGGTTVGVTFTQSFLDGVSNVIFPTRTYDPVLKKIHVISSYNNLPAAGGSDRIVEETLTHQ